MLQRKRVWHQRRAGPGVAGREPPRLEGQLRNRAAAGGKDLGDHDLGFGFVLNLKVKDALILARPGGVFLAISVKGQGAVQRRRGTGRERKERCREKDEVWTHEHETGVVNAAAGSAGSGNGAGRGGLGRKPPRPAGGHSLDGGAVRCHLAQPGGHLCSWMLPPPGRAPPRSPPAW